MIYLHYILLILFVIRLDANSQLIAEEGYWGSPCSSDSQNGRDCSPSESLTHHPPSPFHQYAPVYYPPQYERPGGKYIYYKTITQIMIIKSNWHPLSSYVEIIYDEGYYGATTANMTHPVPFVRVVKRRTTANKKERRRTQSINSAFTYLRDCIPNVPSDTKLSKVS